MSKVIWILLLILLSCITFVECKKKTKNRKVKLNSSSGKTKDTLSCARRSNSSVCKLVVNFCPHGRNVILPFALHGRKSSRTGVRKIQEELAADYEYEDYVEDYEDPYDLYYMSEEIVNEIMESIDTRIEKKIVEKLGNQLLPPLEPQDVVMFLFSPETIIPGVTEKLHLNCSVPVPLTAERYHVLSIAVDRQSGSRTDMVALLTEGHKPLFMDTSISQVSGHLSDTGMSLSYLAITWSYPGQDISGHYSCSVRILNNSGEVSQVKKDNAIEVVNNQGLQELNSSVSELQRSLSRMNLSCTERTSSLQETVERLMAADVAVQETVDDYSAQVKEMHNVIANQNSRIEALESHLRYLRTSLSPSSYGDTQTSVVSKHVETGTVLCAFGGTKFWDSGYFKNITTSVPFNTPYERPPFIFLSFTLLDVDKATNLRVTAQSEYVSASGFRLVCSTWHDIIAHNVEVSWLSIAQ